MEVHRGLPQPSQEQADAIALLQSYNIVCDSVAGSGKTTTLLHIAKAYPHIQWLLLTYNQRLKLETREKVCENGITNLKVHSYHSFAVKHYDRECFTDSGIANFMKSGGSADVPFSFAGIIIDEAQDMTPLYYKLVCNIFKDANVSSPVICIVGDKHQSIFKFNNSDERFITYADQLFAPFSDRQWKHTSLRTSFRITNPMCNFINESVLGYERMAAVKQSTERVRYIKCDCFSDVFDVSRPFKEIMYYLDECNYDFEDVFIIAPSVRSVKTPVRMLANLVSKELEIPIFVPTSDEDKLDADLVRGKMVFSTFHQVKGLERKVVLVFGFDDSYPKFYNTAMDPSTCPNEMYVALTRAAERMTLFHHKQNNFLPFINVPNLLRTCYTEIPRFKSGSTRTSYKPLSLSVTNMTRHLPYDVVTEACAYFEQRVISPASSNIDIASKSLQGNLYEGTSEITGTAIPAYYAFKTTGRCVFPITRNMEDPSVLLRYANDYCCHQSDYVFKKNQIQNYDWLSAEDVQQCVERMHAWIADPGNARFENEVKHKVYGGKAELHGMVDCVDSNGDIWEFKCVSQLDKDHFIQLAIYGFLAGKCGAGGVRPRRLFLANILTNEVHEIVAEYGMLQLMCEYLVDVKKRRSDSTSDEDFLNQMKLNRNNNSTSSIPITTSLAVTGIGKCLL